LRLAYYRIGQYQSPPEPPLRFAIVLYYLLGNYRSEKGQSGGGGGIAAAPKSVEKNVRISTKPKKEETTQTPRQRFIIRTDYFPLRMEAKSVIKKQDNTPDDLYAALSEVVEEIIRHFSKPGRPRIIGYTILSPGPSLPPVPFSLTGDGDRHRLPYETIDTDQALFITAQLPPDVRNPPHVRIMENAARVFLDNRVATIRMKFPVDVPGSYFSVRNGVIDIVIRKRAKSCDS